MSVFKNMLQNSQEQSNQRTSNQKSVNTSSGVDLSSSFKDFDNTPLIDGLPKIYMYPGTHLCDIIDIKLGIGELSKLQFYALDLKLIKTTSDELSQGSMLGWCTTQNLKFPQYYFSEIKKVLSVILGTAPSSITTKDVMESVSHDFLQRRSEEGIIDQIGIVVCPKKNKKTGELVLDREGRVINGTIFVPPSSLSFNKDDKEDDDLPF